LIGAASDAQKGQFPQRVRSERNAVQHVFAAQAASAHGQGAAHTVVLQDLMRSTPMKGELPLERQAVQVQLNNGDWQAATYQDGQFVDLYGLPLDHKKITSWRPAGGNAGTRVPADRNLRTEQRVTQR
jgi:hypothetical protein